jgi:hypothetical protein
MLRKRALGELLHNIIIEFGIFLKLVRLVAMSYHVRIGKHLSDAFPIQNGLKQGDTLS